MEFKDIPRFIGDGNYEVNIPLSSLLRTLEEWRKDRHYNLQLCPDFQRGHVWTEKQQIDFVEFFLRGGKTGRIIYFNKPSWNRKGPTLTSYDDFVCVDGLQRLTSLTKFLKDELIIFGQLCSEFGGLRMSAAIDNLKFNINSLQTKKEVLEWYLEMNTGGTPHSELEINRVKKLLKNESAHQ